MHQFYQNIKNNKKKEICLYLILFLFFLNPISVTFYSERVSLGYLHIFFPFIVFFFLKKNFILNDKTIFILFFYLSIFIGGFIFNVNEYSSFILLRSVVSFLIFISVFSISFIYLEKNMIISFKISLVIWSIYKILLTLFIFLPVFISNDLSLFYKAKFLGTPRFGLIYISAFWIIFFNIKSTKINILVLKIILLIIILIGIYLTFSRATYFAFFLTCSFFSIVILIKFIRGLKKDFNFLLKIFIGIFIIFIFYLYQIDIFGHLINEFNTIFLKDPTRFDPTNIYESFGYRINEWRKILIHTFENIYFGSGYLGNWILDKNFSGTPHSYFFDVMFRTGLFGFILFIVILSKLFCYLYKNYLDLFYGFLAAIFMSNFHDVFKIAPNAFFLSFLISLWINNIKQKQI